MGQAAQAPAQTLTSLPMGRASTGWGWVGELFLQRGEQAMRVSTYRAPEGLLPCLLLLHPSAQRLFLNENFPSQRNEGRSHHPIPNELFGVDR